MSIFSYFALENVVNCFGIIYTLFLLTVFRLCGIWHIIWILPIVIFVQTHMQYDVVNKIYEINKSIPILIFNPLCLIPGAIFALSVAIVWWKGC